MTDKEAMQMALDALETVTAKMLECRDELAEYGGRPKTISKQLLWDSSQDAYVAAAIPAAEALRAALAQGDTEAEQPSELVQILDKKLAWVDLQKEAQKIVESKFLWKRFIDGTPLSNDISCWMADFAEQCTAPQQREWHPLTDEEISKCLGATATSGDTLQLISAIAAALKEKNHD